MMRTRQIQAGFTMLEMAMVLTIVALIAGGVMATQFVLHSAKIRAQVKDIGQFTSAVATFQTRFNEVPGDMKETSADRLGFTPITGADAGQRGCGDGNGIVEGPDNYDHMVDACPGQDYGEILLVWDHLSKALLLRDSYDEPSDSSELDLGHTLPALRVGSGFVVASRGRTDPALHFHLVDFNTNPQGFRAVDGNPKGSLSPLEASEIDAKLDDGEPGKGSVRATLPAQSGDAQGIATPATVPSVNNSCSYEGDYNMQADSSYGKAAGICGLTIKM